MAMCRQCQTLSRKTPQEPGKFNTETRTRTGTTKTDSHSDSFIGAYAVQYVKQKQQLGTFDVRKAISYAHKAAARTIGCLGAQESLPWMDEIEQR
jgi:hypothetical protein